MRIRQDYCRVRDCIKSTGYNINTYYTGSKAERLDLPGSDDGFTLDINSRPICKLFKQSRDTPGATQQNMFMMSPKMSVHVFKC